VLVLVAHMHSRGLAPDRQLGSRAAGGCAGWRVPPPHHQSGMKPHTWFMSNASRDARVPAHLAHGAEHDAWEGGAQAQLLRRLLPYELRACSAPQCASSQSNNRILATVNFCHMYADTSGRSMSAQS